MSKPYREDDLSDQLNSDRSWRLKELSDFKSVIRSSIAGTRQALLRALIPILYAHWEGHVSFCAEKYFEFLTIRRLRFDQLERQIYVNSFLPALEGLYGRRAGIAERCALILNIINSFSDRFSHVNPRLIDTKANLNSDILNDICVVCGIDFAQFADKSDFIDRIILRRRNMIAHGEEAYVTEEDIDGLIDQVIDLMRLFGNALENKIYQRAYIAA